MCRCTQRELYHRDRFQHEQCATWMRPLFTVKKSQNSSQKRPLGPRQEHVSTVTWKCVEHGDEPVHSSGSTQTPSEELRKCEGGASFSSSSSATCGGVQPPPSWLPSPFTLHPLLHLPLLLLLLLERNLQEVGDGGAVNVATGQRRHQKEREWRLLSPRRLVLLALHLLSRRLHPLRAVVEGRCQLHGHRHPRDGALLGAGANCAVAAPCPPDMARHWKQKTSGHHCCVSV